MSKAILAVGGKRAIADILVGSLGAINGVYLEFGKSSESSDAARSKAYFSELTTKNYIRCVITEKQISDDGKITMCAVLPWKKKTVWVTKATLAVLDAENPDKDTLILTVALDTPIKPTASGDLTVSITFSL